MSDTGPAKLESFKQMESEVAVERGPPTPVDSPVKSCQGHWIAIELTYSDDRPVGGHPYEIKLPSGAVLKGNLDEQGYAMRDDFKESGTCTVTFPGIGSFKRKTRPAT